MALSPSRMVITNFAANDNARVLLLKHIKDPARVFQYERQYIEFGRRVVARHVAAPKFPWWQVILLGYDVWELMHWVTPGGSGGDPLPVDWDNPGNWQYDGFGRLPHVGSSVPDTGGGTPWDDPNPLNYLRYEPVTGPYVTSIFQNPPSSGDRSTLGGLIESPAWPDWHTAMVSIPNVIGAGAGLNEVVNEIDTLTGTVNGQQQHRFDAYARTQLGVNPIYIGPYPETSVPVSAPDIPFYGRGMNPNWMRYNNPNHNQRIEAETTPEPAWKLDRTITIQPLNEVPPALGGHSRVPPDRFTKEKKGKAAGFGAMMARALDRLSETSEVIDSIYEALPDKTKKRWERGRTERDFDQMGQYGIDGADWKMQALWYNWHLVDVPEAMKNILYNEIEDRLYGKAYQARDRVLKRGRYRSSQNVR